MAGNKKEKYDLIVSLGGSCATSARLRDFNF